MFISAEGDKHISHKPFIETISPTFRSPFPGWWPWRKYWGDQRLDHILTQIADQ
jgi:hypothetical protein